MISETKTIGTFPNAGMDSQRLADGNKGKNEYNEIQFQQICGNVKNMWKVHFCI